MTKAIMCTTCGQVVGPRPRKEQWGTWSWCADPCAHSAVRWRDGVKGLLEVTSFHGPEGVVIIGLNNQMFSAMFKGMQSHEGWRLMHDVATDAPGYLFDKSKRDCWAVLIRPGESNDTFFVDYSEAWSQSQGGEPDV